MKKTVWIILVIHAFAFSQNTGIAYSLTLDSCINAAINSNPEIRASVEAIRLSKGERLSAYSRFLPQLSVRYGYKESQKFDSDFFDDDGLGVVQRQRVLEFGETDEIEFQRLLRQQKNMADKEYKITSIASSVRSVYFALRVIQEQLAVHDSLLKMFDNKALQAQERLGQGIGLKTAMLSAKLNCLEEKELIADLIVRQKSLKTELLRLVKIESFENGLSLSSPITPFTLQRDSCVNYALVFNRELAKDP